MTTERSRLVQVYSNYDGSRWSPANRGYGQLAAERTSQLAEVIADALHGLVEPVVLDLGCGEGADQSLLESAMGGRGTLVGVELRFDALSAVTPGARRLRVNGNAARLPFRDGAFNLILMSTMLSSVLDKEIRQAVSAEVARVLRNGGRLVVYDMRYPNPQNPSIRPITKPELKGLFPGMSLDSRSISVIPQLSRAFPARYASGLYAATRRLSVLRSHRLSVLRKPNSQVRVAHVTSSHPPNDPRIYFKEVASLRAHGYDVTIVAPAQDKSAILDNNFIPLACRKSRLGRWLLSWPTTYRRVQRLNPVVIHFHDPDLLPLAMVWAWRGHKVFYDSHESLRKDVGHKPYLKPWQSRMLAPAVGWVEYAIASRLTHTIAATPAIAAQWRFPATVVANFPLLDEWDGIDSTWDSYRSRPNQGCYAGVIHAERCTEAMVNATGLLHAMNGGSLVLAGPMPDDGEPTGPGIAYVGKLARPAVADLMGRSRFGLVIYQPAPNIVEALPTKVLEYMAAGLPVVISTSLKVGTRIVREARCGLVVSHDDPQGLADAMRTLLENPEAAWEMGQRGYEAVNRLYSWAPEASRLISAYEEYVGPPK